MAIDKTKSAKKSAEESRAPVGKYYEAVGRRKTSVARVRLSPFKNGEFSINNKPYEIYFPTPELKKTADDAFTRLRLERNFSVSAKIKGGGIHSQAEALRHGISRALLKIDAGYRKPLKNMGFLKRDPRMKERRKFGLKKARKAPQWAKR